MRRRATRRQFLQQAGTLASAAALGAVSVPRGADAQSRVTLPFENGERELVAFPQKRPLIVLTSRPPQLETPSAVFNDGVLTPNDAFFVRYHWSGHPLVHRSGGLPAARRRQPSMLRSTCPSRRVKRLASPAEIRRGQPVLGKRPRPFRAARERRPDVEWRDGQRTLDRHPVEGGSRESGRQAWRAAGCLQRPGSAADRRRSRFRQGARHRPRARRRGDAGLADERRRPPLLNGYPLRLRRARLLRHLLDQAPVSRSRSWTSFSTASG